ncbi:MAG: triose-phosphate isomerase [Alphaproteobacteria bacterium]|nr:triose-phosphate isomerase [Alphaproteobacteria bacterium]
MTKLIVGNWKMHGEPEMARALVRAVAVATARAPQHVQVVVCPPALLVSQTAADTAGSPLKVGGQNCHEEVSGAFTGDISAPMLKAAGAEYVIVGHSERRAGYGETSELVRQKAEAALKAGLIPIICIGETLAERENGFAADVVAAQVIASLPSSGYFVLAYEPVWAIGSGKTPSADDIKQMHAHIIAVASQHAGVAVDKVAVLYGGSVKADNAAEILALEGVSGVLVGGASVKADEFCKIIEAA